MRQRRIVLSAVGLAGAVLGVASVAWACTTQARILALSPNSGPERTNVSVRGEGLAPGGGPVELRWNGVSGPTLATARASGAGFSTEVTVPDAAPGVYTIVAVSEGTGVARVSFELTPAAGMSSAAASQPSAELAQRWSRPQAAPPSSGNGDPSLALGVGLLTIGLVALSSGSAVAVVRRRRASVTPRSLRSL